MAIKILISGYENSGKSTLVSKINNSLVINCDFKEYTLKVPHFNVNDYKGYNDFKELVVSKIKAYKDKFDKLPEYVIFDTITQLYNRMSKHNAKSYKAFEIHNKNEEDTFSINDFIEKVLINKGINTIIVAHTIVDELTGRHTIPAKGGFKKSGSWLSVVSEAIFIDRTSTHHNVVIKSDKFPVRSLVEREGKEISIDVKEFDINKYLKEITDIKVEVQEYEL